MLDFGLQTTTTSSVTGTVVGYNDNEEAAFDMDGFGWSNWSTYAPAILYNAIGSAMTVELNQSQKNNLFNSSSSSSNASGGDFVKTLTEGVTMLPENNDDQYTTTPVNPYRFVLPLWRQILWSILFGGMVIVATGGNLIVVWIVMTTKRMRTVTNYFIVNLSIADVMVSSLNVTFNYYYMLDNDWPFGEFYCKVSQFIALLSICASVFTLMAISIDRYVAIMKPLQPRMSKRRNLAIAAIIWLASTLISCPYLVFFRTEAVNEQNGTHGRIVCFPEWPDGPMNYSKQEHIYNILIMVLTYFLPIISMTATYSRVGIELWGSKTIGEYTPRQVENVRSKRRVVKMMIVVVLIFGFCWLPFHTYFIVTSSYPAITEAPFIQEVYFVIYWLAMSNSMYNPIIYCWMNSRFRYGFKMFFRWCPFVRVGAESLSRRENLTSRYSCSGSPDHNRIKRNDTQKSILYACPSSPKSHRISHCGVLRTARGSTATGYNESLQRFSAPISSSTGIGTDNTNASGNNERSRKLSYQQEMHSLSSKQQQQQQQQQPVRWGNNDLTATAADCRTTQLLS